jgi:kynurenine formamidase
MIIDLTHTFLAGMPTHVYDERPKIEHLKTLQKDGYNDWRLTSCVHVGTHIDGPGHLTDSTLLLSDIPVDTFFGNGYLVDARGKKTIDATLLTDMPHEHNVIVLIATGFDKKFGLPEYFADHPIITEDFAHEIIKRKIKMIGLDFFSPDTYPFTIHKMLCTQNVLIIENLTGLEKLVGIKKFDVIALPLKLATDSALARVVAVVK